MTDDDATRLPEEPGGPVKRRKGRRTPREDSVVSEGTLRSPKGRAYRVIRTTQRDEYEESPAPTDSSDARDDEDVAPPASGGTEG